MNGDQLAEELDRVRERLLAAVDLLPDEALLQPGAVGSWSIGDTLAHLTVWEAELVTGLMKINEGRKPERLLQALENRGVYSAARYAENRERDLDRIFDDLFQARRQLERWIGRFREKDLVNPGRFKWLPADQPLADLIAVVTCQHEAHHAADIEAFAEPWLAADETPRIQAADIEVLTHDDSE